MKLIIRKWLFGILACYGIITGALIYWQIFADLSQDVRNPRRYAIYNQARGTIFDRNGEVLVETIHTEDKTQRVSATPSLFHVTGYFHRRYGMTGLEWIYNDNLVRGQNIQTTLDLSLQKKLEDVFAGHSGAVVVTKPTTGEVLALLSAPYIDPNDLDLNWADNLVDVRTPFVNRVTHGIYPPGSVVKPLVLAGALGEEQTTPDEKWIDLGSVSFNGRILSNYRAQEHGEITTEKALAVSSNTIFGQLAVRLGRSLLDYYDQFGLGSSLQFELPTAQGFITSSGLSNYGFAQLGIGQGDLAVTPLQIGRAIGAVANGGVIMDPYLVQELRGGFRPRQIRRPSFGGQVVSSRVARQVRDAMVVAIREGTGQDGQVPGVVTAGKTGTAQNPHGADHSWFVGFAPASNPQVCVVIIVEHGGAGSQTAAPIGSIVLHEALRVLDANDSKG